MTTIDAHVFCLIMKLLPFSNMSGMPRVCTEMRDACLAIDGGWRSFVESRMVRFIDNTRYFSRATGWIHHIGVFTIKLPKNKKRSAGAGRTIYVGTKRHKLRMRGGVEYALLGPNFRYPTIHASDHNIDENRIDEHNAYWSNTL